MRTRQTWELASCSAVGIFTRRNIFHQRRHRRPEHLCQRFLPANFVAPHRRAWRRAAHSDEANHLLVNHDGKPAGIRKLADLYELKFRRRILGYPVHQELAWRAKRQRRARLHLRRDDIEIALAIHAIEVDVVAIFIEHDDADLHALRGRGFFARFRDALRRGRIDGGEILNLFGGLAGHDELLRHVLSKRHAAQRDCCADRQSQRQSQSDETCFHFCPPPEVLSHKSAPVAK